MDIHRVWHQGAAGCDQPQRMRAANEQTAAWAPPVATYRSSTAL